MYRNNQIIKGRFAHFKNPQFLMNELDFGLQARQNFKILPYLMNWISDFRLGKFLQPYQLMDTAGKCDLFGACRESFTHGTQLLSSAQNHRRRRAAVAVQGLTQDTSWVCIRLDMHPNLM
jgi:hypothetical protein